MRAHTQVIRGEFYEDQLFRYLDLVLRRLDTVFHRQHGVDAIAVLQVIRSLAELVEDRFNIFIRRQSEIFKKRKPAAAVRKFVELFPELGMTPDEILASLTEAGVRPEHARDALVEFTNTTLTECFTVSRDDIASVCPPGAETSAILQIIDQWSLSFSDLAGQNLDHLHLDKPIWRKPFIRLGDGQLFWPTVTSSSIFAFEMFETLIDPHEPLSIAYHDARAEMLEDELTTLLARYFPAGKVMRQLQWSDPATTAAYENDAVVAVDRYLLIFEAKSRRVSSPALRGAPDRLALEIRKVMVEPAEQSKRLMDMLLAERRIHCFQSRDGPVQIDSRAIDTFVRVNVSLETIGDLNSRWPELAEARFIAQDAVQIPTMSLGDLETICRSLRSQSSLVHYLKRREDFERNAVYLAGELDLLAFYLATGFNIGDEEFGETSLLIYGMSARLDEYFGLQQPGSPVRQPEAKRTPLWNSILAEIERRATDGWLTITHRLLNVSYEDQVKVEKHIALAGNGPPRRREGLAFITFGRMTRQERIEFAGEAGVTTMDKAGTDDCLVVGFNMNEPPAPYHLITLVRRNVQGGRKSGGCTRPPTSD